MWILQSFLTQRNLNEKNRPMSHGFNIEKIGKSALIIEKDLRELEEKIIVLKIRFSKRSISRLNVLQDLDKLLEIIRR